MQDYFLHILDCPEDQTRDSWIQGLKLGYNRKTGLHGQSWVLSINFNTNVPK